MITLAASERVLVDAGPGTGKTHVACARIANLISEGIEPGRIWVISFTRTAIAEFRARIANVLGDEAAAASVQIRTLDAHAWILHSGFSQDAKLTGSYDDNIRSASKRIREDEDAADYLSRLEHLIIDEAQDVLAHRADWCLALIDRLDPACGVTVFADEAQSIYDFTEEGVGRKAGQALPAGLRSRNFKPASLNRIHRTSCPRLRKIFSDVRRSVLMRGGGAVSRCLKIQADIKTLAHENAGSIKELNLDGMSPDTLILLRRRVEVLERSAWAAAVPHRLRMSGLPARILPWIAALLWDFTSPRFSRDEFEHRWSARISGAAAAGAPEASHAWNLLYEAAGEEGGRIDIRRLRTVLGRSSPPALFCSPEFGDRGPVMGTIHASKGREAANVRLYLPLIDEDPEELEEETRVSFVGATRARTRLAVGEAGAGRGTSLENGRVWKFSKQKIRVEIGRPEDLLPSGLAGKATFPTREAAETVQLFWRTSPWQAGLVARPTVESGWNYELGTHDLARLGVLSPRFTEDMRKISNDAKRFPPAKVLPYVRSIGIRSIVLAPDDPELQHLHEPFASSGFLFAPMLTGFPSGFFGRS